ncbi:B-cell receptor CD22-like [Rhineura floridana]|uniref:B-cell receptor CD22-like n=1 Tax=Rhineura floridana TaxID=261503 RepID=UPI002AC86135|nr:B-cell receptor CD22-like [Rhineura floridana]
MAQVWHLHGSTMRSFFCLIFLPGILCYSKVLSIEPKSLTAWEGSCIVIPCQVTRTHQGLKIDDLELVWYFNPVYDHEQKEYNGIVLYHGSMFSTDNRAPSSPPFLGRARFVGNDRNCSLKISALQKSDKGTYGARLYGSVENRPVLQKWFMEATVNIDDSAPKPMLESFPVEIKENERIKVTCSVPYHCPDEPVALTLSGLEETHTSPLESVIENGKVQTVMHFTPTWRDYRKTLTCLLKDHNGRVISQSSMELDVKYAPPGVNLTATPGIVVREGEKLSLKCTIDRSNPEVKYQWYWENNRKPDCTDSKIEWDAVEEQDSGRYRCDAINEIGTVRSETLTIDVQYPPKDMKITVQSGTIKKGDHVSLQCSSRGNPPTNSYKWYKGSASHVIGNDEWLSFEAIQPDSYYCIAYNNIGNSSSSRVTLDVQYAPRNVQLTLDNHLPIKEEEIITLNCTVGSSNPSYRSYKWYKSEKPLRHTKQVYSFSAPPEKAKSYKCEACNAVSCTSSAPLIVDVHFVPKEVKAVRGPVGPISEGSFFQLRCEAGAANPQELTYTWYKDRQRLQLESMLTIEKVDLRDSGSYTCVAKNSVGSSRISAAVLLDVQYGPRNVQLFLNTQDAIIEEMNVSLRCDSEAKPSADVYKWYWNGQLLQETSKMLHLKKIQVKQSGSYHCKTANYISEQESPATVLTVYYSRAAMVKRGLIGLGSVLVVIILKGMLCYGLWRWKKMTDPGTGRTQRPGSFFVKKAKGGKLCTNNNRPRVGGADGSLGFLNQDAENVVIYAALRLPPSFSDDCTVYSSISKQRPPLDPLDETVVYSVVKKPGLPTKEDSKPDYENVVNKNEEELHYSSLVNLAPQPRPTYADLETDSESEESIQYASLKH